MKQYILSTLLVISGFYLHAQKLTIEFDNIRNNEGVLSVTVYENDENWLDEEGDYLEYIFPKENMDSDSLTVSIELEKPGKYAIAVLDDEDGDEKMRHNFIGYPKEGFGFSNNIHVWLSRPKFDECILDIKSDTAIRISMQYK